MHALGLLLLLMLLPSHVQCHLLQMISFNTVCEENDITVHPGRPLVVIRGAEIGVTILDGFTANYTVRFCRLEEGVM